MGMLISCNNGGCGFSDFHRLDLSTNEVHCTKCNKVVNVSPYTKNVLKTMNQVMTKVKSEFEVTCKKCNATDAPALKKFSSTVFKVVCKQCGHVDDYLTRYFVGALQMRPGIQIIDATPEEIKAAKVTVPNKFHPVVATEMSNEVTSAAIDPKQEVKPVKVEYYQPPTKNIPAKNTKVQPVVSEDKLRARIENMSASITVTPDRVVPKPADDISISDMAFGGVLDYAGDGED